MSEVVRIDNSGHPMLTNCPRNGVAEETLSTLWISENSGDFFFFWNRRVEAANVHHAFPMSWTSFVTGFFHQSVGKESLWILCQRLIRWFGIDNVRLVNALFFIRPIVSRLKK